MAEELVLTPGGYRPKSLVHFVEPGNVLRVTDGRILKLDPAGKILADHGVIPSRPGIRRIMPGKVFLLPRTAAGLGQGWITYAFWNNDTGTPISSFSTTFVVPPPPVTQSGQLIYLFPGIMTSACDWIYQPVLQWGLSPAGGGNYWSVASWYVARQGTAFHTQAAQVNPGDVLVGVITLTGESGGTFSYNCTFEGIVNTSLPVENTQQLTSCSETLEAYGLTKCTDYPNILCTAMRAINLELENNTPPTIDWLTDNTVTDCGQHTIIVSNLSSSGEVDLWYSGRVCRFRALLQKGREYWRNKEKN
jgi:hypothetical protein